MGRIRRCGLKVKMMAELEGNDQSIGPQKPSTAYVIINIELQKIFGKNRRRGGGGSVHVVWIDKEKGLTLFENYKRGRCSQYKTSNSMSI